MPKKSAEITTKVIYMTNKNLIVGTELIIKSLDP